MLHAHHTGRSGSPTRNCEPCSHHASGAAKRDLDSCLVRITRPNSHLTASFVPNNVKRVGADISPPVRTHLDFSTINESSVAGQYLTSTNIRTVPMFAHPMNLTPPPYYASSSRVSLGNVAIRPPQPPILPRDASQTELYSLTL